MFGAIHIYIYIYTYICKPSFMIDSWNHVASETYPNWLNWDGTGFSYHQGWSVDRPSSCWKHQHLQHFFCRVYSLTLPLGPKMHLPSTFTTTRTSTPKRWTSGIIFWQNDPLTQVGEYHSTGGIQYSIHMGVSKNNGTPKSSILIGFSTIFTIHFGVPLFLETPILISSSLPVIVKHQRFLGGDFANSQAFGLSETLGAFVGGVLVAETDYKHQIEARGRMVVGWRWDRWRNSDSRIFWLANQEFHGPWLLWEFCWRIPFFYYDNISLVISLCHGITQTSKLGFPNLRLALGPKKYLLYLSINWKVPTRMPSHHRHHQGGDDVQSFTARTGFAILLLFLDKKIAIYLPKVKWHVGKNQDFPLRTGDFQADVLECQNFKG